MSTGLSTVEPKITLSDLQVQLLDATIESIQNEKAARYDQMTFGKDAHTHMSFTDMGHMLEHTHMSNCGTAACAAGHMVIQADRLGMISDEDKRLGTIAVTARGLMPRFYDPILSVIFSGTFGGGQPHPDQKDTVCSYLGRIRNGESPPAILRAMANDAHIGSVLRMIIREDLDLPVDVLVESPPCQTHAVPSQE